MLIEGAYKFGDLRKRIAKLAGAAEQVARESAEPIAEHIRTQWREGYGPAGRKWEELAASTLKRNQPRRQQSPLLFTGAMFDSLTATVDGKQITFHVSPTYASFHQSGTSRMPARPIFPAAGAQVPPRWSAILRDAAKRAIEEATRAQ